MFHNNLLTSIVFSFKPRIKKLQGEHEESKLTASHIQVARVDSRTDQIEATRRKCILLLE